ncbi:MAG: DUF2782 domain-containing protein [Methylophilaceae bacterium]|jgi:hypothetical protein|nr:DUF2782 domain-containing protein [Methylophilaceae bacterium]MDG1453503.1 DUF2782 domain-containing protein [Methylophilaceae bacterium]
MHKKLLLSLLAIMSLSLVPGILLAVTPSKAELLEEVEPPPKVQEGQPLEDEPEVTIRKDGKKTIQEYRINGELYMMKVTPDHGVSYYLYKEDQQSDWVNVGPNPPLAVPKWTLFRF